MPRRADPPPPPFRIQPHAASQEVNAAGARRAALLLGASLGALLSAPGARAAAPAAAPPLSPAWFAARQGAAPSAARSAASGAGSASAASSPVSLQASIDNLRRAAQAINAAQSAQSQARAAALLTPSAVPDGLAPGGLQPAAGAVPGSAKWQGADLPAQAAAAAGRTKVTVRQTAAQAILNWSSFNVGRNTDLSFDQSAGNQAPASAGARPANSWTVLNRVAASTRPSQILGSVTAQGQVLVINQSGILFGPTSQINVNSLLASTGDIPDAQYLNATAGGIYANGTTTDFTGIRSPVAVQAGASIATYAPASAAQRGGFVLLIGSDVTNAGAISTPDGQTQLAAGASVGLKPGFARTSADPNGNTSTTLGNEVSIVQAGGSATNTGLIQAATGDVTLAGRQVVQAGVVTSTTSVTQRGTVHLLADAEAGGGVTLAAGGTTLVTPDSAAATAVDATRSAQFAPSAALDSQRGGIADRSDLSRIEVTSGSGVEFQGGSLTLATGGQIAVTAAGRVQIDSLAALDAAGAVGVSLPASANTLEVNVQGFQLRDAPANRDTGKLASLNAYVDASQLVLVPAQSGVYASDRYYTPGGLLEVGGELGNVAHSISEWLTPGGVVTLAANEVVAQTGASVNIAGGSLSYAAGKVQTTWLTDAAGRIYNINTAPANVQYVGVYQGATEAQPRWGVSKTYGSVLVAPAEIDQPAMTVGRDGGALVLSAPTVVFEASVTAGAVTGATQTSARPAASSYTAAAPYDAYALPHADAPIGGSVLIGNYVGSADTAPMTSAAPVVQSAPTSDGTQVAISAAPAPLADSLAISTAIPVNRLDTAYLSASMLSAAGLGGLSVSTTGPVSVSAPVALGDGAAVSIVSPSVTLSARISARGGSVAVSDVFAGAQTLFLDSVAIPAATGAQFVDPAIKLGITLAASAAIDTRGLWTNAETDPSDLSGEGFVNGGTVTLDSTQTLQLAAGSVIDASAGGILSPAGKQTGGAGGGITLTAFDRADLSVAIATPATGAAPGTATTATFAATLRSAGTSGGGTLTINAPSVVIGGQGDAAPGSLLLAPDFFQAGFSAYAINGYGTALASGLSVAPGARVRVTEPTYIANAAASGVPTGGDPAAAFDFALLPLYVENASTARLTRRPGASISLTSEPDAANTLYATTGSVTIGEGASVEVDPGQSIRIAGDNQITVLGALTAPGGKISVVNTRYQGLDSANLTYLPGMSVWLGPDSRIDAAGRAVVALDKAGRPYGVVQNGGTVTLGAAAGGGALTGATTDAFVIARPGSVIDASGAAAELDPDAGQAVPAGAVVKPAPSLVASDAGSVSVDSSSGVYLDGALRAAAGGPNASGGALSITLPTPNYAGAALSTLAFALPAQLAVPREITVAQQTGPSPLRAGLHPGDTLDLAVGQARVSAAGIEAGGFDKVALASGDAIVFDGAASLRAAQSISLTAGVIGDTATYGEAKVSAPYVQLNGLPDALPNGNKNIAGDLIGQALFPVGLSSVQWNPYGAATSSRLTVAANLVDVSGSLYDGVSQSFAYADTAAAPHPVSFQIPGFRTLDIESAGDVRFIPAAASSAAGASSLSAVYAPGDVVIDAAQIYPTHGDAGYVVAGFGPSAIPKLGAITAAPPYTFVDGEGVFIGRSGGPVPDVPLTAGGSLTLAAGTVVQNGVVRAPDGVLQLGVSDVSQLPANLRAAFSSKLATGRVELGAASLTSVSGAGASIPYGGTADGVDYLVGTQSVLQSGSPSYVVPLASALTLAATSVAIDAGASADLSGGGELTGAGFVTGRGGSSDVLGSPLLLGVSASARSAASGDQIYAVLPGFWSAYAAPATTAGGTDAAAPAVGERITFATATAGLPAGTYTLLPAIDALLPGAFRVEIGGASALPAGTQVQLGDGSVQTGAVLGVANTSVRQSLAALVTVTPGAAVRTYSSYNETTYSQFTLAQAALFGAVRADLPADAKRLILSLTGTPSRTLASLTVDGDVLTAPASGGRGAEVDVSASGLIHVTPDAEISNGADIYLQASALDALGASTLSIGGYSYQLSPGLAPRAFAAGSPTNAANFSPVQGSAPSGIDIASGATLSAAEVFLVARSGGIAIEQGAVIDTVGRGDAPLAGTPGLTYRNAGNAVVAASNGQTIFEAPTDAGANIPSAPVTIGGCAAAGACTGRTGLFAGGSLTFSTSGAVSIADDVRYGARDIDFAVAYVNIGSDAALARAVVPPGLTLSQQTLSVLLAGDPATGAPPLQSLTLTANQGVNFYGSVSLNTLDPSTGKSTLDDFVLNTPSIYGYGGASDAVTVTVGALTWNGVATSAGASAPAAGVIANGPGTGQGSLTVNARSIVLGYGPTAQPDAGVRLDRTILGFSGVTLQAGTSISANNTGSLSVYESQTYAAGKGFSGAGGSLALVTPLLTGAAGSTLTITSGGPISLRAPQGSSPAAAPAAISGATLTLNAGTALDIASAIVLPSGRLALNAAGDILIESSARLDLAGRTETLVDKQVSGFGGDVAVASAGGAVTEQAGAAIDVSAPGADAGSASFSAAGAATLDGALSGAGGASGAVTVNAARLIVDGAADPFAAFNAALDAGGVFGARSFDLKTGDLSVGGTLRANAVTVSVDGGALTVAGVIDASGAKPGSIRLSAQTGLTLAAGSRLLAQASVLHTDSDGVPIDSENRPTIELASASGAISLAAGAVLDVSSADGVARGTITLDASRTADGIAVSAAGPLAITGAASIAANAFKTYTPADPAGSVYQSSLTAPVSGGIDLDAVDRESKAFIDGATTTGLAGLTASGAAFHLRPGVEIDAGAASGGNLTVQGDLDLSGYRYGPAAKGGGTGEPGALVLRASGNLNVFGSVTDGFAAPSDTVTVTSTTSSIVTKTVTVQVGRNKPVTTTTVTSTPPTETTATLTNPDDSGFVLQVGSDASPLKRDTILPTAVTLGAGTTVGTGGSSLNYAVTLSSATGAGGPALQGGATLPADIVTGAAYVVPAGTVVRAPITAASGAVLIAAGTLVAKDTPIPAGSTIAAGNLLPSTAADQLIAAAGITWPAGASLAVFADPSVKLSADATAPAGGVIPAGSVVQASATATGLVTIDGQSAIPLRASVDGRQGSIYALGQLLPAGTQSWSLRLVAGADEGAADQRAVGQSAISGTSGTLTLSDPHVQTTGINSEFTAGGATSLPPEYSVVRTGTGTLELLSGGSIQEGSSYGVYTAGAQNAAAAAYDAPRATRAGPVGGLAPSVLGYTATGPTKTTNSRTSKNGVITTTKIVEKDQVYSTSPYESLVTGGAYQAEYPSGGGDVLVSARGDVTGFDLPGVANGPAATSAAGSWLWRQGGASGQPAAYWINFGTYAPVASGAGQDGVTLTGFTGIGALGGGNVTIVAGGDAGAASAVGNNAAQSRALDVSVAATGQVADGALVQTGGGDVSISVAGALNTAGASTLTDLRGAISVRAGSIGAISPVADVNTPASQSALTAPAGAAIPATGLSLTPGDATVSLSARGDLSLLGVGDATLGSTTGPAAGSFSLWRPATAIDLFSAGGDVAPGSTAQTGSSTAPTLGWYPATFRATAAGGSIYGASFELTPSPSGQLELLALDSIDSYSSLVNDTVAVSGADPAGLSSPLRPAYAGALGLVADPSDPLAFGTDTADGTLHAGDPAPALIYAATGDIVDVSYGETVPADGALASGKAVRIVAGRDVVNLGRTSPPSTPPVPDGVSDALIVSSAASDVSVVQAGRDIIYARLQISGPGQLYVQAGRDVYQGDQGVLQSIQPVGRRAGGAGISVVAGAGAAGPDWTGFASRYLDPKDPADAPYLAALDQELTATYGRAAGAPASDAAFLAALSPQAQGELLEPIYFGLLRTSGREFTDPASIHYKSYVTGRNAVAALFPSKDASGAPITYSGSITLFPPGTFIRTDFGGDVNLLAPGGEVLLGSASLASAGGEGVLTQGQGNIGIYALGSVLLGQSRVFTTFGGGITIWSAQGDINAGRGAGGTQGFSPVSIVYDQYGDISVSPSTTTTGAGIATLAPIAGVPAGDVDLIAPLGTIDAGEAGIRVSGNVNLAALTIANAANIQVGGKSSGIPTVAVPNVGVAISTAGVAAGADQAAEEERRRQREASQQPAASLITVEVTDFGG